MTEPKNVTPEDERVHIAAQEEPAQRAEQGPGPGPGPEVHEEETDWTGATWRHRGRNFPWLGWLLLLVGIGLLIQAALPPNTLSAGTVLLFALGISLTFGWAFGGSWLAAVAGLLLTALGASGVIRELNIYTGPGTTALCLAVGFLVIWVISLGRDRTTRWPLIAAGILGLIGAIQLIGRLSSIPELSVVWPVVIIGVGVVLLITSRRR